MPPVLRAIAACSALLVSAVPAAAAEFELRFGSINLADTRAYREILEPFARGLEADSGGRIAVDLKPLGGYGKAAELFNMAERGDIEIAATVQGYNPGRFPQTSVMELPLMFDSAAQGTEALGALRREGLLDRDYATVKVLGLYMLPPYGIFTTGRPVEAPKDLRGMRIRTPSPTIGVALLKLGMVPVGIPVDMIGDSLAKGSIEALAYGWDSATTTRGIGDGKLIDLVKVMVDLNFASPSLMVVMNKAAWERLPPDLQTVVERRAPPLSLGNAVLRDEAEGAAKDRLRAGGARSIVSMSLAARADIERQIAPTVVDWKAGLARQGLDGEALYARARELLGRFQAAQR